MGKEACQEKFRKDSLTILEEMKALKGTELNKFIAKNTDEKASMVQAGIKPYQAEMFVEQNINELCPMMEKYRQ